MFSKLRLSAGFVVVFGFFCGLQGSDLRFPHFAQGTSGTGFWVTEIVFQNVSNTTSSGVIYFRNDAGAPLFVSFEGGFGGTSLSYQLRGGESAVLTSGGPGPLLTGWVEFDEVSGSGLTGVLTFTFYENIKPFWQSNLATTEVAVLPSPLSRSFVIPVDYHQSPILSPLPPANTGIAIVNPLETVQPTAGPAVPSRLNIALLLVDSSGSLVRSAKILDIGPFNHSAKFIHEFMAGLPPTFKGSLIIVAGNTLSTGAAESGDQAVLVGLKLKNGLFSSIPANTSFFLPAVTPRTAETGADNNSTAGAFPLTVLPSSVEGSISVAGDRDFYAVNLNQNDLLVAHLENTGTHATFAPELMIRNLTVALESFLPGEPIVFRAPATGTFYLNVGDSGDNDGGPTATYRLTVVRVQ
ncbi:MAG: hypothetical protein ACR2L2_06200 [Acidobacteriota bacterium]